MKLLLKAPTVFVLSLMLIMLSCRATKERKDVTGYQVEGLKDGILLVRLKTNAGKIEKLREVGESEQAEALEKELQEENRRIQQAFNRYFDFCPVYFFTSDNSAQVKEGHFAQVLLDASSSLVSQPGLDTVPFLVAEFGRTQEVSGNAGIPALIVMDSTFTQLPLPFPSTVRTAFYGSETKHIQAVENLNANLYQYFVQARLRQRKREIRLSRQQMLQELKEN